MLWWKDQLVEWMSDRQRVTNCPPIRTDDSRFPIPGYVPGNPEGLRRGAQRVLKWRELPLDAYSLARMIAGAATVEEKVALADIAQNSAARHKCSISDNLLHNAHNIRLYGDHTQGRRFPTALDPTAGDIQIANFVLSGVTAGFTHNADMVVASPAGMGAAMEQGVWVGPIEGVDPRRMMGFRQKSTIYREDKAQNEAALAYLSAPEEKLGWRERLVPVAAVAAITTAFAAGTSYAVAEFNNRRWKDWR